LTRLTIPTTLNTSGIPANMAQAQFMTPAPHFFAIGNIALAATQNVTSGGVLVYNGDTYQSYEDSYDNNPPVNNPFTIFKRQGVSVSSGAQSGPFAFQNNFIGTWQTTNRVYNGPMGLIPPEWQQAFEAPCFVSDQFGSIWGTQSAGPFFAAFDPADIGVISPIPNQICLGYAYENALRPLVSGTAVPEPIWNFNSNILGVAFPPGTRSVLFIGRTGHGPRTYGDVGLVDLHGSGLIIVDPADGNKGYHSWPYRVTVWAYDANDLLAVKAGDVLPYNVQPYSVWTISDIPGNTESRDQMGGITFDPATMRLYYSQARANGDHPLVHVLQITI